MSRPPAGLGRLPRLGRLPGLGGWDEDPWWADVYSWSVAHPRLGGLGWRLAAQSDLRLLYAATDEIGDLPAGARVLDVPSGNGVALRGLRPGQDVEYVAADLAPAMLDRTVETARRRGVADQVSTCAADVGDLPFETGGFDLVVTFTGLHCFPDPARAIVEMARVLRPGGVVTGSSLHNDSGLRHEPMRRAGRLAGLLGPGLTRREIQQLWAAQGVESLRLVRSGALVYFRGVKGG